MVKFNITLSGRETRTRPTASAQRWGQQERGQALPPHYPKPPPFGDGSPQQCHLASLGHILPQTGRSRRPGSWGAGREAPCLSSPRRSSELSHASLQQPWSSACLPQALQPHTSEILIFIALELQHIRDVPVNIFPPHACDPPPPVLSRDTGLPCFPLTFQRGKQSLGFQWPPSLMEGSFEKNWWISSIVISLIFTSMGPSVETAGRSRRGGQEPLRFWGSLVPARGSALLHPCPLSPALNAGSLFFSPGTDKNDYEMLLA